MLSEEEIPLKLLQASMALALRLKKKIILKILSKFSNKIFSRVPPLEKQTPLTN
jgi:hypothetical protein